MKKTYCEYAFDHIPHEVCQHCRLEVDSYGNTEEDFLKCSFPHCGCDGARLCMAGEANSNAEKCNVEGMYHRTDYKAKKAIADLIGLCGNDQPTRSTEQREGKDL